MRNARTLDGVEYAPERKFRVVAEGVTMSGMTVEGPNQWGGFRADLPRGTEIVCRGFGPGWGSDPGYGVEWKPPEGRSAVHCEVRPDHGGMWAYRPAPGLLEPVDE